MRALAFFMIALLALSTLSTASIVSRRVVVAPKEYGKDLRELIEAQDLGLEFVLQGYEDCVWKLTRDNMAEVKKTLLSLEDVKSIYETHMSTHMSRMGPTTKGEL